MKDFVEQCGRFGPTDAKPPQVLNPGDGSLDSPATLVATERASVLGGVFGSAVAEVRGNQPDVLPSQFMNERIAAVGFVANDPFGPSIGEHKVEKQLYPLALVPVHGHRLDRHRRAADIKQIHDFHAFSGLDTADPVVAALGSGKLAVDETVIQPEAVAFADAGPDVLHNPLEDNGRGPDRRFPAFRECRPARGASPPRSDRSSDSAPKPPIAPPAVQLFTREFQHALFGSSVFPGCSREAVSHEIRASCGVFSSNKAVPWTAGIGAEFWRPRADRGPEFRPSVPVLSLKALPGIPG